MDKPTKLAIIGLIGAGLVVATAHSRINAAQRRMTDLTAECQKIRPDTPGTTVQLDFQPICDAYELTTRDLQGVQKELGQTYVAFRSWQNWGQAALVIGGLSLLPWTWYFLLRRIAELRDAIIGGKRPG